MASTEHEGLGGLPRCIQLEKSGSSIKSIFPRAPRSLYIHSSDRVLYSEEHKLLDSRVVGTIQTHHEGINGEGFRCTGVHIGSPWMSL